MIKYMHIERLGNSEVKDILNGIVYIQPKLDGANGQIYFEDGEVKCASRKKELNNENTNQGFWNYVQNNVEIFRKYFQKYPDHILYGEWLVPHTIKYYREDAWRNFYVFDIYDSHDNTFVPYDSYFQILQEFGIEFVPCFAILQNATEKDIEKFVENNTFLTVDKQIGEGIVIKRYDFVNQFGNIVWAKLVKQEFKEENLKIFGSPDIEYMPIEVKIAQEFVTIGRLNKVKAKILEESEWSNKKIPEYLNRVWYEIITEEMWNILKKHKNATINFKDLNRFVISTIKQLDKEVF